MSNVVKHVMILYMQNDEPPPRGLARAPEGRRVPSGWSAPRPEKVRPETGEPRDLQGEPLVCHYLFNTCILQKWRIMSLLLL